MIRMNRPLFKVLTLSLLRMVTGLVFLYHGTQKMFGVFGGINGYGISAHLLSPLGIAAMIESVGALLMIVGLFTRPVALILAAEMAFIYYRHHARGIWPVLSGGAEIAILCCVILLFLSTAETGPWTLDRVIRSRT
jgi:putative oxidoreductase